MKRSIIFFAIIFSIKVSAITFSENYVPKEVNKTFHEKFPDVRKVKWKNLSNGNYEADFSFAHKTVEAYFDSKGNLLETDVSIRWVDVPVSARYFIYDNFTGCQIDSYKVVEKSNKQNLYQVLIERKNYQVLFLFNQNGEMVKMKTL